MKNETVQMVALRKMYYGGDRQEGETFEVKKANVNLLLAVRSAALVKPTKRAEYKNRQMTSE